LLENLIREVRS